MTPGEKHIFVANDNDDFLALMESLLTDEFYRVTTCRLGRDSYQEIKSLHPDLVILDLRIPDFDGWQILQLLKLDPHTSTMPVLICSAAVAEVRATEQRLREQGCDILLKPFNLDELLDKVRALICAHPV
jgi:DNA-binding response OmpR family regulator